MALIVKFIATIENVAIYVHYVGTKITEILTNIE